jgi:protein TonB
MKQREFTMLQYQQRGNSVLQSRWISASIVLHLLALGILLYSRAPVLKATQLPGDHNGHYLALSYVPGQTASPASAKSSPEVLHHLPDRLQAPPKLSLPSPSITSAPSVTLATTTGTDALGDGDIKIASVLVHPHPDPDLSQLPSGTSGDVVVDVVIDSNGHVAKFTMSRGLGHGVDETVLATIQHWTFQPATRNGIPVASEQELLFHYERG